MRAVAIGCAVVAAAVGLAIIVAFIATLAHPSPTPPAPTPVPVTTETMSTVTPSGRIADAGMSEKEKAAFLKTRAGRLWKKHHGEWSPEDCKSIAKGLINIGMDTDMVRAAWGSPERRNVDTYASGSYEQWVYGDGGSYVYFRGGVVTSISQSHR